jgi:hypothetical protein
VTDKVVNLMEGVQNLRKAVYEWVPSAHILIVQQLTVSFKVKALHQVHHLVRHPLRLCPSAPVRQVGKTNRDVRLPVRLDLSSRLA